jgi:hypothetical protein
VILNDVMDVYLLGLSSVKMTLTSYIPGSVSFELGYILKLGYLPYINCVAIPKSHETNEAVSSISGSIIKGNIRVLRSLTFIWILLSLVLKKGGPVFGTMRDSGM